MMKFKKIIKYCLFFLLFIIVSITAISYYFLNTESGLKQAISLANRYSGYQVSAEKIQGKLWQKTELQGVKIKGKDLELSSQSVVLAWQPKQLWDYRVVIKSITLNDTVVTLASSEKQAEKSTQPLTLPDIKLPIDIDIEDVSVTNFTLNNPVTQKPAFVVDSFQLGMDYTQQRGEIHTLRFRGADIDLSMQGHVITKGDYPLMLVNKARYTSTAYGSQVINADIQGDIKKSLAINIKGEGLSDFSLQGTLDTVLTQPNVNVDFLLEQFDAKQLNLPNTAANAALSLQGAYQTESGALTLKTAGQVTYHSPQTDKVRLDFEAALNEQQLSISALTIDLLTANQQLTGQGSYHLAEEKLDFSLKSPLFSWPQSAKKPELLAKALQATLTGTLADYRLNLSTVTETAALGEVPLTLAANGHAKGLDSLDLQALINEQPLEVSGKVAWQPAVNYALQIAAKDIAPFKAFPGVKDLMLNVAGDEKTYQASGKGHIFSTTIAPSDMDLAVTGTMTALEKATVHLKTLGGEVTAQASGQLVPLNLSADLALENIQPQTFYSGVDANIQAKISTAVTDTTGNLLVTTQINQFSGQLQKKPLSGKGQVIYDQGQQRLEIKTLDLNLAGNVAAANGVLALDPMAGKSNVEASIDAKDLAKILPDLSGSLQGKLLAKGNLKQPELTAKLQGKKIKYQQNQVAKLAAEINISLAKDRVDIATNTSGVRVGNHLIDKANVTAKGKLSGHTLQVDLRSPKQSSLPTVVLAAKGGLDIDKMAWAGKFKQLKIISAIAGQWQMPAASEIALSADKVAVKKLCLRQQSSSLCANGKVVDKTGQFSLKLNNLSTQQFAKMMPAAVNVKTVLDGEATIHLVDGKPEVKGKIIAKGGQLRLASGSGGLVSKIQQFETKIALKNNRVESLINANLSKLGNINLAAALPDTTQPTIRANMKLDSKDLLFLEELVPQLSDVKGRLTGDMTVSGNPAKQLNLSGKVTLQKMQFNVPQFGTEVRDLTLDIFAKNGNSLGFKGGAKAGGGQFSIDGSLNPLSQKGQINIKGRNFQVANSRKLKVAISPDLQIVFAENIKVRGDVLVPKALIVPESSGTKVTASDDVVWPKSRPQKKSSNSPIDAEVNIKLGDDVRVASADVETRLSGQIKVIAKPRQSVIANGVISLQTGELRIYGQLLNIERGRIIFANGPIANPSLDIRTSRKVDDVTVGATLLGSVQHPEISLFSTPGMPDSSILSYLLFGRPPNSDSFSSTALLQTGGLVGANAIARDMRASIGLDVLNFTLSGMEAGKHLSKKLYVGMKADFFTAVNEFLLKYKFNSTLHVDGTVGNGAVSVDLIKVLETD